MGGHDDNGPCRRLLIATACLAAAAEAGPIPTSMPASDNAGALNLGSGGYTGTVPTELGKLTLVTSLNMQDNELTGSLPSQLGRMTGMTAW